MKKHSYDEILTHTRPASIISYIDNKVAAYIVYIFQDISITANLLTFISFLIVLIGIIFLFFNLKILAILFLILAYTFDNVDGIWARFKKQNSEFGKFFDGFMDSVKYFLIDLALIIYYFDLFQKYFSDFKLLLIIISLYFIIRALFYSSYFNVGVSNSSNKTKLFVYANPAERYFVVFPLIILSGELFILYFLAFFVIYFLNIFRFLQKRLNYQKN